MVLLVRSSTADVPRLIPPESKTPPRGLSRSIGGTPQGQRYWHRHTSRRYLDVLAPLMPSPRALQVPRRCRYRCYPGVDGVFASPQLHRLLALAACSVPVSRGSPSANSSCHACWEAHQTRSTRIASRLRQASRLQTAPVGAMAVYAV